MEAARGARRDELARLGELAALAVAEASGRRGGPQLVRRWADASPAALSAALGDYLDAEDRGLWVGTIDDHVVGLAAVRGPQRASASLDLIFVEPEARGVGVGECLLDGVLSWLGERGSTGLDAVALPGDRDTKQFFEGSAMVARLLTMHRAL